MRDEANKYTSRFVVTNHQNQLNFKYAADKGKIVFQATCCTNKIEMHKRYRIQQQAPMN